MADDRETAAKLLDHRSRHLSRVGSGVELGNVLRAPGNPAARQSLRDWCTVRKRPAHRVTETLGLLEARLERVQQPCVRCEAAVHLPVACYQPRAHPVRESRKGGDSTAGSPGGSTENAGKFRVLQNVLGPGPRARYARSQKVTGPSFTRATCMCSPK